MLRQKAYTGILFLAVFFCQKMVAQPCPTLISPLNNEMDVPVDNLIQWTAVDGIIGYLVSLGTTPGGGEIINRRSSGLNNFYQPEIGLPENTTIYVTIRLFLPDQPIRVCPLQIFRTEDVTTPPECTTLFSPVNGDEGVNVNSDIRWNYAPRATDYLLSVGTVPGGVDLVDNVQTGNVLFYRPPTELPIDREIFVSITPINENGEAEGCTEESFSTGLPTVSCAANSFPNITLPEAFALCAGQESINVRTISLARGYRWYRINADGTEELLSEINQVILDTVGTYRVELYNTVTEFGATIECPNTQLFEVVLSDTPVIRDIALQRDRNGLNITVEMEEPGRYEYALENSDFAWQTSPNFTGLNPKEYTIYVRDRLGCGMTMQTVDGNLSKEDFPAFFTPNGDGINDYWQYSPIDETTNTPIETIRIYDRYGALVAQIDPNALGWDGTFNGNPMPPSDYWFRATSFGQKEIKGHFTLKR